MSKFIRKGKSKGVPPISTASLPDIVFMLLFFFMVSTTMKETEIKVKTRLPEATETVKLEKKSLVSYIYVGSPKMSWQGSYGTDSKIQLDDSFSASAAIVGNELFLRGERYLYCIAEGY